MAIRTFEGMTPSVGARVYVDDCATLIGNIRIGDDVSIWPGVVVRGDVQRIEIGAGTNVQDGSVLHVTHAGGHSPDGFPLLIGCRVTIGHRAVVHGCRVGDACLIGIGAVLMDGVAVDDHVMIGAGSLVPPGKKLEAGFLYVGTPAKPVRRLKPQELEFLDYSAEHYIRLKNRYLSDRGPESPAPQA